MKYIFIIRPLIRIALAVAESYSKRTKNQIDDTAIKEATKVIKENFQ